MRALTAALLILSHAAASESKIFPEDSSWQVVSEGHHIVEGIAALPDGSVFLTDVPGNELFKIAPDGKEVLVDGETGKANGLAVGPKGRLFGACMGKPAIRIWNLASAARNEITLPTPANDLAITNAGVIYYTWGAANAVFQLDIATPAPAKVADVPNPNGITLSHDGSELWVGEFRGDTVLAFPILPDGKLGPSRPAFKARVPENGIGLLDGMTPLPGGRLLAATALGLQILTAGSEPVLIPNPTDHRANYVRLITDADGRRWIYVAHEKSVLRRRTLL